MKKVLFFLFCFLSLGVFAQTPLVIKDMKETLASLTNKVVTVSGKSELHLTATTSVLTNTTINLTSDNSWVFFDNVRPAEVITSYLKYFSVNGVTAVKPTNIRLSIYKQGTVVIPEPANYQALKVYTLQNYQGDSASYSLNVFNSALGTMDNKIRSFKLKRGYMATLATSADGSGYSRVFIADDSDLEVPVMTDFLDQKVSSIRVMSWEYTSKKGWCGYNPSNYNQTNSTWRYDWNVGGLTDSLVEYVPIRQNGGWPGWDAIKAKTNVTHVLGFNEPDHTEQANLTVAQALAEWPDMIKTGLRIGSPACTNFNWLYEFMDSCKARNYRVDFVAIHAYWGGKSPQNWYNDIKYIHDRTGCPIWITEWNNGANWTTEAWPDADHTLTTNNAAKMLSDLKGILQVLDTASFIERYSIYNWVQDCRAMVLNNGTSDYLTPAGAYYAADNPPLAFNRKYEVTQGFKYRDPSLTSAFTTKKITVTVNDPNFENYKGYIVERKIDNGTYSVFGNTDLSTLKTCSDTLDISLGTKFRYRAKSKIPGNLLTAYSNETGWDVTNGSDIQLGTLAFNNVGWNNVLFRSPYTAIPTIILGSPSGANAGTLLSPRVKLVSYSSRFTLQLSPWSYQNISSLLKDETVPYLILSNGSYDFGGLKAQAGKTSVGPAWTTVTFTTAFDTIPVVFVNQILPASTNATVMRIKNVTKTGFQARIMKESGVTATQGTETVTYFAITPGTGLIANRKVKVGRTGTTAISPLIYSTINFGDSIPNPIFISQLQTCNDDTVTACMRYLSVSAKYANVIKQREKSLGITAASSDGAGWMVVSSNPIINGIENTIADRLSIYPNPVKDILYIRRKNQEAIEVEIYNFYGVRMKSIRLSENEIPVGDLPTGCYILKTKGSINKFVKY